MIAQRELYPKNWKRSIFLLPMLMAVGVGLTMINTRAVLEALFGVQTSFVRTPKYAIGERPMKLENKQYRARSGWLPYLEIGVGTYFLGMVVFAITTFNFLSIPFLALFVVGYYWAGFTTLYQEHQSRLRWMRAAQSGAGAARIDGQARRPVLPSVGDAAVAHVDGGIAVGRGFRIVGDHQDGLAQPAVQIAQNVENRFGVLGVQIAGGLVGQENGRVVHDGAGDGDALLLAAGKLVGFVIQAVADAEQAQDLLELRVRAWRPCRRCGAPRRCCRARSDSAAD